MNQNCTRRDFLAALAAAPLLPGAGWRARSRERHALILVWLDGGMSHIDTFDGKPEASVGIRGELPSRRAFGDAWVSARFERLAPLLDRCALLRSLSHGEGNHDRGTHYLLTGHRPSAVLVPPALGAALRHAAPSPDAGGLPDYVCVPSAPAYGGAGFLPAADGPFATGGDPGRPDFRVRDLVPDDAAARRAALRDALDALDGAPRSASEADRDRFVARARRLSLDPDARARFDLRAEPDAVRARYGRHRLGQSCLLARRLVEGGTRTVVVHDPGWDHHTGIARALDYGFPPKLRALDDALAGLIEDLDQRGLAERVTVCVASEFGRTPRLNPAGGRDHWPRAQSVLLFGGGIARGAVVGRTDARGEEPVEAAASPADLVATLYAALGVDLSTTLASPEGRPVPLFERGGRPIAGLLARR